MGDRVTAVRPRPSAATARSHRRTRQRWTRRHRGRHVRARWRSRTFCERRPAMFVRLAYLGCARRSLLRHLGTVVLIGRLLGLGARLGRRSRARRVLVRNIGNGLATASFSSGGYRRTRRGRRCFSRLRKAILCVGTSPHLSGHGGARRILARNIGSRLATTGFSGGGDRHTRRGRRRYR
jgi:hypothetical protein